ncbi:MAG: GNAT family N-acetyltransferase [Acetobacteraceae bacterium]
MIRRAGPPDARAMAAIHAEVFADGIRPAWGTPWGAAAFAAQLGLPGALGLIDSEGGTLLARVLGSEAELLTLAVIPRARRRGLGAALVSLAMREAASAGVERIVLEVGVTNTPARALYENAGFYRVGLRRAYYADHSDALLLAARLPHSH